MHLQKLDPAFPLFVEQLEDMLACWRTKSTSATSGDDSTCEFNLHS